jgi:hypothetical protein
MGHEKGQAKSWAQGASLLTQVIIKIMYWESSGALVHGNDHRLGSFALAEF